LPGSGIEQPTKLLLSMFQLLCALHNGLQACTVLPGILEPTLEPWKRAGRTESSLYRLATRQLTLAAEEPRRPVCRWLLLAARGARRGASAKGFFEVTHDITHLTCADFLRAPASRRPSSCASPLSSTSAGRPESIRDPRGFARQVLHARGQLRHGREQHPRLLHPRRHQGEGRWRVVRQEVGYKVVYKSISRSAYHRVV